MTDQVRISDRPRAVTCEECGHPTTEHYAYRMVDWPRETNGHCGDHTRCMMCESSTDQIRISDDGQLEIERTWDGQPLWSTETEQERLFAGDAFQQMPGQLPIEEEPERYANGYTRSEFSAGLTDAQLRIMLARYAGPALERARDEAAYRGWTL